MKDCNNCIYAEWNVTKAGKLHPSGDGRCTFPWKMPALPASMYWFSSTPKPMGGQISRKKQLSEHCVYFSKR